jgi:hypothetical protein
LLAGTQSIKKKPIELAVHSKKTPYLIRQCFKMS